MSEWRNRIVGSGLEDADQLLSNPSNWRIHPQNQQKALKGSLSEIGWVQNVIVNQRTGFVVDGHARVALAISAGEKVPVVYVDLSPDEEKTILATIDPLSAMAGTDKDLLSDLISSLKVEDAELQEMLDGLAKDNGLDLFNAAGGLTDPDDVPAVPEAPITVLGDLWLLGRHRLLCGDSTSIDAVERLMSGDKADMVFTDPPYGINFQSGMSKGGTATRFEPLMNDDQILDIAGIVAVNLCDDGAAFIWTGQKVYPEWREQFSEMYKSTIIWHKPGGGIGDLSGDYAADYEMCLFCVNGRPQFRGKRGMAVWTVTKDQVMQYKHPTQKPVELAERAMGDFTDAGDSVLDLFGGSGSTLIACEKTARNARLMELDPKYVDVILKRWQDFSGQSATLDGVGRTFNDMQQDRISKPTAA